MESILSNEKYKGSALLQKSFTVDFLAKKTKINEGEVPQYYVEDSHPAIIDSEEWQAVQAELERRKHGGKRHRQTSPFPGKYSAETAERFSVQKFGTPPINIAAPYGNATESLREIINAKHRIFIKAN